MDRTEKVEDWAPGVIGKNREMDRKLELKDRKEKVVDSQHKLKDRKEK
ncbi:hypothetical protein [Lysinibacillus sp.]|nr:hypothetical protein [Lysinibacillus sp.]